MKVNKVIEILTNSYEADVNLIIDWVDEAQVSETLEITPKVWKESVKKLGSYSHSLIDMDYVLDVIREEQDDRPE